MLKFAIFQDFLCEKANTCLDGLALKAKKATLAIMHLMAFNRETLKILYHFIMTFMQCSCNQHTEM